MGSQSHAAPATVIDDEINVFTTGEIREGVDEGDS